MKRWSLIRAVLLFSFGMALVAYEVVFVHPVDLTVMAFGAAAMGLPVVLHRDEQAKP